MLKTRPEEIHQTTDVMALWRSTEYTLFGPLVIDKRENSTSDRIARLVSVYTYRTITFSVQNSQWYWLYINANLCYLGKAERHQQLKI